METQLARLQAAGFTSHDCPRRAWGLTLRLLQKNGGRQKLVATEHEHQSIASLLDAHSALINSGFATQRNEVILYKLAQ